MKNYLEYLKHIRDECEYLVGASEGLFYEKFIDDETLRRAFVRSLEIIGEATKQIPVDFKDNYPSGELERNGRNVGCPDP